MKCAFQGCQAEQVGKSKYCAEHREAAHAAWLAKVRGSQEKRAGQVVEFAGIYKAAREAGLKAGNVHEPVPMIVQQHANMADDNTPVVKEYFVPNGVCGFAWVNVAPGTCAFARWLVKQKLAHKAYYGGVDIWVSEYGQSMEKKMMYAAAFAKVLNEHGITAYAGDRID